MTCLLPLLHLLAYHLSGLVGIDLGDIVMPGDTQNRPAAQAIHVITQECLWVCAQQRQHRLVKAKCRSQTNRTNNFRQGFTALDRAILRLCRRTGCCHWCCWWRHRCWRYRYRCRNWCDVCGWRRQGLWRGRSRNRLGGCRACLGCSSNWRRGRRWGKRGRQRRLRALHQIRRRGLRQLH